MKEFSKSQAITALAQEMGARLRYARNQKKLSQAALLQGLDDATRDTIQEPLIVDVSTLSHYENGGTPIPAIVVAYVCPLLGISPQWLFTGEDVNTATVTLLKEWYNEYRFQSTLPVRGATCQLVFEVALVLFQSTLPVRGATAY